MEKVRKVSNTFIHRSHRFLIFSAQFETSQNFKMYTLNLNWTILAQRILELVRLYDEFKLQPLLDLLRNYFDQRHEIPITNKHTVVMDFSTYGRRRQTVCKLINNVNLEHKNELLHNYCFSRCPLLYFKFEIRIFVL